MNTVTYRVSAFRLNIIKNRLNYFCTHLSGVIVCNKRIILNLRALSNVFPQKPGNCGLAELLNCYFACYLSKNLYFYNIIALKYRVVNCFYYTYIHNIIYIK